MSDIAKLLNNINFIYNLKSKIDRSTHNPIKMDLFYKSNKIGAQVIQ